jgi:hypothetical protein
MQLIDNRQLLRIRIFGTWDLQEQIAVYEKAMDLISIHGIRNIFIDVHDLEREGVRELDLLRLGEILSREPRLSGRRMAIVLKNKNGKYRLIKAILKERGIFVREFADPKEAKAWLTNKSIEAICLSQITRRSGPFTRETHPLRQPIQIV